MADALRLETEDKATSYNLLTGNVRLADRGYFPEGYRRGAPELVDTLDLVSNTAATIAQVRTALADLDEWAEIAGDWAADTLWRTNAWIVAGTDGESLRRAFIREIRLKETGKRLRSLLGEANYRGALALVRVALWESYTSRSATGSGINAWGGTLDVTGGGTATARIGELVVGTTGSYTRGFQRVWIGIKPKYEVSGTLSSFVPVWAHGDGGNGIDATTVADTDSLNATNVVEVSFSTTATMALRLYWELQNITGVTDDSHMLGKYVVIARARVTGSSTTIGMRIRTYFGLVAGSSALVNETVYQSSGSFYLPVELGTVTIPPGGYRAGVSSSALGETGIVIDAERVTGTGTLRLDGIVLVPATHLIKLESVGIIDAQSPARALTHPDGTIQGEGQAFNVPLYQVPISATDWGVPRDGGRAVVVAVNATDVGTTETVDIELNDIWDRWRSYRG